MRTEGMVDGVAIVYPGSNFKMASGCIVDKWGGAQYTRRQTAKILNVVMRTKSYNVLNSVLTAMVGAGAGYLAARPFWFSDDVPSWYPRAVFIRVFTWTQTALGGWFESSDGELLLAMLILGLPSVLIIGLGIGIFLPHIKHQRVLIYSILIWPVFYWSTNRLVGAVVEYGERSQGLPPIAASFQSWRFGLEMIALSLKYLTLYLLIFLLWFTITRLRSHND